MVIPNSDGKPKRNPIAKSKNRESVEELKKGDVNFLGGDFKNLNNIIDKMDKIEKDDIKVKNNNNRYVNVSASKDHINIDKKIENIVDQLNKDNNSNNIQNINNHNLPNKNENSSNVDENFVVYKKPVNNINVEKKEKDPMVWDPPEEKRGNIFLNNFLVNKPIRNGGNPIKRSTPPRINRKVNGNK